MEASGAGEPVLPTTETDDAADAASKVTEEQWNAMRSVVDSLLAFRDDEGHDPSRIFHKRVNRRIVPDYYEVIKEPMAFSNLKQKTADREYKSFTGFVRDCALIWHNAHTYNRPDAGAYQDASVLKDLMEEGFQRLAEKKLVKEDDIKWPDLGEIPPVEDLPEGEEEDEEEEEEDEDEEDEDSGEEKPKKRRGPGRRPRRDTMLSDKGETGKKRRGRPPKVDTPMEARIKNVLKGLRKLRNDDGLMIYNFEKLPERSAMPEYYEYIKKPMSIDQIKKSLKRKRYRTIDDFMRDVDLMFENAKLFNEDDSQIHLDAIELQKEAHRLAEIEKGKSDTEYVLEEGRKPRPAGIEHNGELWKVGDWVHINNANDTAKPIVAQIFRTYEDSEGQEWVNACWYYRPEQTVHHFEKHFYPMEVVKTGQYRDHPIDDVINRCFVMFFTRFSKGRPRALAPDAKVYVCEARYNEEKHKINKIKTWASCLPDEIRDQDYEMDMFTDGPRPNKKGPSPLLYMVEQGNVTEEVPQPKWGEENAPPIVGGMFKGQREENQTPPPGPTPSPPPPGISQPRPTTGTNPDDPWGKANEHFKKISDTFSESPAAQAHESPQRQSYTPQPPAYKQPSATPTATPLQPYSTAQAPYPPQQATTMQISTPATYHEQYATPNRTSFSASQPVAAAQQQQQRYGPMPVLPGGRQADAFILNDLQNAQIPDDVRQQFLQDEAGHVIFFTKPPLATLPAERVTKLGGHTIKYMATKLRRQLEAKMQAEDAAAEEAGEAGHEQSSRSPKRRRLNNDNVQPNGILNLAPDVAVPDGFAQFIDDLNAGTAAILSAMRPDMDVNELQIANLERVEALQTKAIEEQEALRKSEDARKKEAERKARELWQEPAVYLDDLDPGY